MNQPNALKQYKNVDLAATVQTASPHKLISMMLAGAIEAFAVAKGAMARDDIELRANSLNKAMDIIVGLKASLDLEKGGELAANLDGLYNYILQISLEATRDKAVKKVEEAISHLTQIQQGWDEMPLEHRQ